MFAKPEPEMVHPDPYKKILDEGTDAILRNVVNAESMFHDQVEPAQILLAVKVTSNCGVCHAPSSKIRFTKAELRPIFREEMNFYRKVLARKGVDIAGLFPKGTVFHNIMGELVVDGKKVLRLSYDEDTQDWKVRFFKDSLQHRLSFEGSDLQRTIRTIPHFLHRLGFFVKLYITAPKPPPCWIINLEPHQ